MTSAESHDFDLVVAGGGIAGVSSAIAAAESGASVLLVEKTASLGGSAPWSGGNLVAIDGEHALEHLRLLGYGRVPDSVLSSYLRGLDALPEWLRAGGATLEDRAWLPACWPNLPGADGVRYYAVAGGTHAATALWTNLEERLARSGAIIRTETTVSRLESVADRVVGVRIGDERVGARKGVVLATGGFENDPTLIEELLPVSPLLAAGATGSTGDGISMAREAGAALWHLSTFFGFWSLKTPDHDAPFPLIPRSPSWFLVDADGRRFHDETGREAHDLMEAVVQLMPRGVTRPGHRMLMVFDDATAGVGPLAPFPNRSGHQWSTDNRPELSRWGASADDPTALARAIGIDEVIFEQTFSQFHRAASTGLDDMFHRAPATMRPLAGTLHAFEVHPSIATSSGGPRRDAHGRVLRADGSAIPGLYAAGGNGSVWAGHTHHGGGLTDGLVFGRLAAEHALSGI